MADYTGLANYLLTVNNAINQKPLINALAREPVVRGLANTVATNPVVQSVNNYIQNKTPLEVAGDVSSVGAIAAAMSNPVSAGAYGLARVANPRLINGAVQLGKEVIENEIAERAMSNFVDIGLIAEDAKDIRKALKR